jgi:hypothetical protein
MRSVPKPLPEVVTKRIWKIAPLDPARYYSSHLPSPRVVAVLENGRKEVFRTAVKPVEGDAFVVENGWLVHRSFPRRLQALKDERAATTARLARRAAIRSTALAAPAYKDFLRRVTRELGKPRAAKACGRAQIAFKAPNDARCAELIEEARRAHAAATLFLAGWGRELRVVPGGPAALCTLFGDYFHDPLETMFEDLDADGGLTFDYIADDQQFALHLARRPRRAKAHAANLIGPFGLELADVTAALNKRALVVGDPASTWRKTQRAIIDPAVYGDDDDD